MTYVVVVNFNRLWVDIMMNLNPQTIGEKSILFFFIFYLREAQ